MNFRDHVIAAWSFLCPTSGGGRAGRRRKAGTGEEWLAGPAGFGRGGMRVREKGARRVSGRDARGRDAVSQRIRSQTHADRLPVLCRDADNEGARVGGGSFFDVQSVQRSVRFWGRRKTVRRGRGGSAVFCLSAGDRDASVRGCRREGRRRQRRATAGARSRRFAAPEKFLTALRMFFSPVGGSFFLSGA